MFNAEYLDDKVTLTWQTATEVNNYGFEVERSIQNSKLGKDWLCGWTWK